MRIFLCACLLRYEFDSNGEVGSSARFSPAASPRGCYQFVESADWLIRTSGRLPPGHAAGSRAFMFAHALELGGEHASALTQGMLDPCMMLVPPSRSALCVYMWKRWQAVSASCSIGSSSFGHAGVPPVGIQGSCPGISASLYVASLAQAPCIAASMCCNSLCPHSCNA